MPPKVCYMRTHVPIFMCMHSILYQVLHYIICSNYNFSPGIPAGMVVGGIAKTHPVSVRKSVTSQELYGMQSYQGSTGPGSQYKQLGNSSGVSHSVTKKDTPPTSLFGGTGQQLGSTPKESVTFDKKRTRNVKDEPIERPTKLKEQIHTASKDNTETETPSVPRVEDAVNKGKNKGQKQEKIPRGEKKSNEATSDTTFTSAANQSSKLITAIQADFSELPHVYILCYVKLH